MKAFLHLESFPVLTRSYYLFFPILLIGGMTQAATWYVKPGGTGTGITNWANAAPSTQLATIIAGAAPGDQVWVVGSSSGVTYYPTTGASRTAAFTLKSGVAVYGGFAGTETLVTQRNYATNLTILSGDIGTVGVNTDNSYHVVVSAGNTGTTVLDGFTITNGNANGSSSTTDNYNGVGFSGDEITGGGIMTYNTTVTISNCVVTNNIATGNGGGVYSYGTTVTYAGCTFSHDNSAIDGGGMMINANGGGGYTLSSCTFSNNNASGSGGGLARENGSVTVTITGCTFTLNTSTSTGTQTGGGGIYLVNNGLTMTTSTLSNNSSSSWGGGILYNQGSNAPLTYCTISSNSAVYGGGMADFGGSAPLISNCKISQNVATYGAGLYCNNAGNPTVSIDTFANNTATATSGMAGGGLLEDNGSNCTISHCWFHGNVTNGGDGAGQYDNSSAGTDSNCVYEANIAKGSTSNGGGLYHNGSTGTVINCVFVNNSCTGNGGGIYNNLNSETYENCTLYDNSSGNSTTGGDGVYVANGTKPHITNDIIWSTNSSSIGLVVGSGTPKINFSDIQGQTQAYWNGFGGNNQNTAPTFTGPGPYAGVDGKWATADDGLHLAAGSVGADAVTGSAPTNFPVDDIADAARPDVVATNADMGAYEGPGGSTSLAVQLLNFTAASGGSNVVSLNWDVDAASQAARYQVQKSGNGTDFSVIGTVNAAAGQISYQFTDENATGAVICYRLQIIQPDGSETFSLTVIVRKMQETGKLSLRPSVAGQGSTTLYIRAPQPTMVSLIIIDASGRVLSGRSVIVNQGDNYVPLDISGFARGAYYVYITGEGGFRTALSLEKL
jgi:hypothetical protein